MADGVNKMRLKAKEREKVKFLKAFKQGRSGVNTDLCKRKRERERVFPSEGKVILESWKETKKKIRN